MRRKEVLEDIKGYLLDREIQVLEELVERDTPMKVKHENNGIPYCAVCERSYLRDGRGNQNRFCGYCGQRLDWSE